MQAIQQPRGVQVLWQGQGQRQRQRQGQEASGGQQGTPPPLPTEAQAPLLGEG